MTAECQSCRESRRIKARGLCVKCYSRLQRSGDMPAIDPSERVWRKVAKSGPNDCWEWTAHVSTDGYGRVRWDGTTVNAHRVTYQLVRGGIPQGMHLDHLCRNRACVNPDHLEPVTPRENVLRAEPANRTHCPQGHVYDELNTVVRDGKRHCRTCHRTHQANYLSRRKTA